SGPRVFQLEKSLSSMDQGSLSVTQYYNAFKSFWDEYVTYRTVIRCTCGACNSCTCNIFDAIYAAQQSNSVMKFLIGLNDSFSSMR
ncbi:Unknown protein, partial [Striga hermonthica]